MKRIGFVDFNLENYHANVFLGAIRKELAGQGFGVAGCTALMDTAGRAWGEKNGVPYFATVGELSEQVDCLAVLAPSNPEVHWDLCKAVLPFGKPTYVDKPFASDLKTARKIFALADRFGAAVQTASALRYTNVQAYVRAVGQKNVRHMVAWGAGRSFGEYAIHPTELVVSCMGAKVQRLMRRGGDNETQLLVDYSGGRTAVINLYLGSDTPFAASVTDEKTTKLIAVDTSRLFVDAAAGMLDFFEAGKPLIDRAESLAILRILEAAKTAPARKGFVKL